MLLNFVQLKSIDKNECDFFFMSHINKKFISILQSLVRTVYQVISQDKVTLLYTFLFSKNSILRYTFTVTLQS